jgi:hypothetical protein
VIRWPNRQEVSDWVPVTLSSASLEASLDPGATV